MADLDGLTITIQGMLLGLFVPRCQLGRIIERKLNAVIGLHTVDFEPKEGLGLFQGINHIQSPDGVMPCQIPHARALIGNRVLIIPSPDGRDLRRDILDVHLDPLSGIDQVIHAGVFFLGGIGPLFHQKLLSVQDLADRRDGDDDPPVLELVVDSFFSVVGSFSHSNHGFLKFRGGKTRHRLWSSGSIRERSPSSCLI